MKRKALGALNANCARPLADPSAAAPAEPEAKRATCTWHQYRPLKLHHIKLPGHKSKHWEAYVPGGYTSVAYLSEGAYGAAISAVSDSGAPVVIKIIHCREHSRLESAVRELHNLAFFTTKAPHAGVVRLLDCYYTKDMLFLVLERYDQSLFDLINAASEAAAEATHSGSTTGRGRKAPARIGVEDRKRLSMLLLDALRHFHTYGLVHRDLKPANIVVSSDLRKLAVIDLGSMRKPQDAISEGPPLTPAKNCMTDGYAPPEAVGGDDDEDLQYSREADNFSAGIVLVEMITGAELFANNTAVADAVGSLKLERRRRQFVLKALKGYEGVTDHEVDLITSLLAASPVVRAKSYQALRDVCHHIVDDASESGSEGAEAEAEEGRDGEPGTPQSQLRSRASFMIEHSDFEMPSPTRLEKYSEPVYKAQTAQMQAVVKQKVAEFRDWKANNPTIPEGLGAEAGRGK